MTDDSQNENAQKIADLVASDFNWVIKHVNTSEGDQFHLIPDGDKKHHLLGTACECNPELYGFRQALDGIWDPFYLHHSYDLREIDEWWFSNITLKNDLLP